MPRSGIVALTIAVKHICKLIAVFGPALSQAIDDAHTAGTITTAQQTTAHAFLVAASGACDAFRLISGY